MLKQGQQKAEYHSGSCCIDQEMLERVRIKRYMSELLCIWFILYFQSKAANSPVTSRFLWLTQLFLYNLILIVNHFGCICRIYESVQIWAYMMSGSLDIKWNKGDHMVIYMIYISHDIIDGAYDWVLVNFHRWSNELVL